MSASDLFYLSLNPSGAETIVLLHGFLGSRLEFTRVIGPRLADAGYHVLIPDMPCHSNTRSLRQPPAADAAQGGLSTPEDTIENEIAIPAQAVRVAALIRDSAHGGWAHVVGISMGGFVAMELAKRYAQHVGCVVVTGSAPFQGKAAWMATHPGIMVFFLNLMLLWTPTWLFAWLTRSGGMDPDPGLLDEMRGNLKSEAVVGVFGSVMKDCTFDDLREVPTVGKGGMKMRVLAMAGGKEDDVDATRKMAEILRDNGVEARAFVVKDGLHTWHLKYGSRFSDGVLAWVEGKDLATAYEQL